jgi:hypothetical protein
MATYYKYAERDASNQVNWSEITSNMVNSLKAAEAIRESKRQAIDDATAELSLTLSEAPQGDHRGLNEFAMTYANNAQQMRLMQDKLLKSGQLKLKDYNIGRANLTEGTTQLFNLGKKYQAIYSDRMKKFQDGDTSLLDADMLARFESFANFSNHEAYINPTNGQVSIGKLVDKVVDGKTVKTMDRTPGSFTTVQQLNFSVSQEIPKYKLDNLDAEVAKFADTYLTTDGLYRTIDDVRQMKDFDLMVNDMVQTQVQVPNGVASILKDYVGGFNTVFNKEDQDENSILMIEDPSQPGSGRMIMDVTSEMGKKQKAKAEEFLRRHIDKQLGRKETQKEPTPERESDKTSRKQEELQGNVVDLWNSLYSTTDPAKRNSIVSSIISSPYNMQAKNTLVNLEFVSRKNKDGVMQDFMEVSYVNPKGNRTGDNAIPITDSYVDWAGAGVEIHGVQDKAKREKGLSTESVFGGKDNSFEGTRAGRGDDTVEEATFDIGLDKYLSAKVDNAKLMFGTDDENLIPKLFDLPEFVDLGARLDSTGIDKYTITIPGVSKVFKVTEENMLIKLPQILKAVYKELGLDKELRNRLSKMTVAEKEEWKKNNAQFDIEQILKSDKREESKTNTGTDTDTGGNPR